MGGVKVTTNETVDVITNTDVKQQLRIATNDSTHDNLISACRQASVEVAKEYLQKSLLKRTLVLSLDNIPYGDSSYPLKEGITVGPFLEFRKRSIDLPYSPVIQVNHVKMFNDSDQATTMASSKYYVDTSSDYARVVLRQGETWDTALRVANAIEITYEAGYGTATSSVPVAIKQGAIIMASHFFENPDMVVRGDSVNNVPSLVNALWKPYRAMRFGIGLG